MIGDGLKAFDGFSEKANRLASVIDESLLAFVESKPTETHLGERGQRRVGIVGQNLRESIGGGWQRQELSSLLAASTGWRDSCKWRRPGRRPATNLPTRCSPDTVGPGPRRSSKNEPSRSCLTRDVLRSPSDTSALVGSGSLRRIDTPPVDRPARKMPARMLRIHEKSDTISLFLLLV